MKLPGSDGKVDSVVGRPSRVPKQDRGRIARAVSWILFSVALLVVFVLTLSLVRIPAPLPIETAQIKGSGMGVGLTQGMQAEADLLDPTPLFLPTRINAGYLVKPPTLQLASQGSFQSFQPKLVNPLNTIELSFPPIADLPQTPSEGLRVGEQPNPYRTIGQGEREITSLPSRLGYLEVIPAEGGPPVLSLSLPTLKSAPVGDWHPMEWMASVDRKGLVGNMALVVGSGVEEYDLFFRRYLTSRFRLGERLRPGFYRVRVGP